MENPEDRLRRLGEKLGSAEKEAEAAEAERAEAEERRREVVNRAFAEIQKVKIALIERINELAPVATTNEYRTAVELGDATLTLPDPKRMTGTFGGQKYDPPFDVITYTSVTVTIPRDRYGFGGKSHSLWFADVQAEGEFDWFETAFMIMPLIPRTSVMRPYDLPPDEEAASAISPVMGTTQLAWPFIRLVGDGLNEFVDYWMGIFADAAEGKLQQPRTMPERDAKGTWRT